MISEKEKMIRGEMYDAGDPQLIAERERARNLCRQFNTSLAEEREVRAHLLAALFDALGVGVWIEPPFYCDYGTNITLGDRVYMNFNCIILDPAPVKIGDRVQFGPAVQVYTASHPLEAAKRSAGPEFAKAIAIGNDVWIGGGAIICPGVNIGPRSVIGAGSVVTRDVPGDAFAAGNPCRVIKKIAP